MMKTSNYHYAGDGRYPGSYYAASANHAPQRPAYKAMLTQIFALLVPVTVGFLLRCI